VKSFLDFVALWTAINMIAWFTLWWTYDKTITWEDEIELLGRTSVGATAITLAVWGVTRAGRKGSAVPRKYVNKAESMLDTAVQIEEGEEEK